MAEDTDDSQKTEEPTQKRIEEAIKRGNVAFSRELSSFLMLASMSIYIVWLMPYIMRTANFELANYVVSPHEFGFDNEGDDFLRLSLKIISQVSALLMIPFIITIFCTFLSSILQNGFVYSPEAIMPDLGKISPLRGLKRMFSMRSAIELIKGVLKLSLVMYAMFIAIEADIGHLTNVHELTYAGVLALLLKLVTKMLIAVCVVMCFVALFDYFYQRMEYMKSLRMTKQEVKEEHKQSEGSPEVKSKQRMMRNERAKKRMMAAVPTADVVITNPTHFSVALKYKSGEMPAPKVVAKGADNIAFLIREVAKKHRIPLIEDKPLARMLYDNVEIDEFVPYESYKAVADIIGKVMQIKKRGF
ncbi:MAG: flagellar biosynthesis protein FlhB [Rickettsiales bacterium]